MPGNLAAAMLTELRSAGKTVVPFLELYFTGGTRRYAQVNVASATLGRIAGKVLQWGNLTRSVSDRDNNLTLGSATVVIEDTDVTFSSLIEDANASSLRGARAVIKLSSPNVAAASWPTLFDGYLENWRMDSLFVWTLQIHPNDQPLLGVFPKTPILPPDWPNVGDKTLYGEFVPIIYGIHDSRGSSDAGMVPALYVDRIGFRYLVAQGWVTVDRVYKDGILQSASGYSITHPTIGGRLYTLIDWTSDQGTSEITADVTGYETVGDGSGTTITGVNVPMHILDHFVYADYQGGNWSTAGTVAPVNTTLFATCQTFLTDLSRQKVSRYYGGQNQTSGMEMLTEFCSSLQLEVFFTRAGQIAIAPDDYRTTTLWYDAPRWMRYDLHEVGDTFKLNWDRDSIMDRISVQYIFDDVGEKYVQTLEVRDVSITEQNASDLAMPFSNASLA